MFYMHQNELISFSKTCTEAIWLEAPATTAWTYTYLVLLSKLPSPFFESLSGNLLYRHSLRIMSKVPWSALRVLLAVIVFHILHIIWQKISHVRRAKQWGCRPAFVRSCRLPFGIDTLRRYVSASQNNYLQNDDLAVFEELGRRPTWYQQVLGNWHHVTSDPKNI